MQRVASTAKTRAIPGKQYTLRNVSYEYAVNMPSGDCVKYFTAVVLGTVPNYWSRIYFRYNYIIPRYTTKQYQA